MNQIAITLAGAGPADVVEVVRLALNRGRELGIGQELADAVDHTLAAMRTSTEQLSLQATEPPPKSAPSVVG